MSIANPPAQETPSVSVEMYRGGRSDYRRSMQPRRCSRCGETKEAEYFSSCPRNRDGLDSHCKSCRSRAACDRAKAKLAIARANGYVPKGHNTLEKIWAKIGVGQENDCWEWTLRKDPDGYGITHYKGAPWKTHRLIYTISHGPIPEDMWVLHKCDNPPCCNPNHLFLGTSQDNVADRHNKGRDARGERGGWKQHPESILYGERSFLSKMTNDQVREMRRLYETGRYRKSDLARMFSLSKQAAGKIINGETWRHLLP